MLESPAVPRMLPAPDRAWPTWPLKLALVVLFLGPVVAPLFQATGLPLIADSGALARDLLSTYICPTPAKSFMLMDHPMAVCARCWGATIGLWLAWAAAVGWRGQRAGGAVPGWLPWFVALPWPVRLLMAALPFALWSAEILRWPAAPLAVLLLNGALAGFAAGVFFCSIWPGLLRARP